MSDDDKCVVDSGLNEVLDDIGPPLVDKLIDDATRYFVQELASAIRYPRTGGVEMKRYAPLINAITKETTRWVTEYLKNPPPKPKPAPKKTKKPSKK